jgi:hypothetical protein
MPSKFCDIVFVLDASESMRPCIQGLVTNLNQMIRPLQGFEFKVRVGLVAMSVGVGDGGAPIYRMETLAGDGVDALRAIYSQNQNLLSENTSRFAEKLNSLSLGGDEDHLLALDCAFDFPFGPVSTTRRVVALFSDERIEDGMVGPEQLAMVDALVDKLAARKIMLFAALPESPALVQLGCAEGCQIETVAGGNGLSNVNFSKLLAQMGKTISVASVQGEEASYTRALFGQNEWGAGTGSFDGLR